MSVATAIALVYRGIMFWVLSVLVPCFAFSVLGSLPQKRINSAQAKHRDIGWISGTLVILCAVVNLVMALFPQLFASYTLLTQWIDISNMLSGPALIFTAIILLIAGIGLIFRLRIAWAFALTFLVLIAGFEFIFYETIKVAIPVLLIAIWLFWKRDVFDLPFTWPLSRS